MYHFIIETSDYAGNFERQLCAYLTGRVGECTVGEELARVAKRELPTEACNWFEDHAFMEPDDHGVFRPVAISQNSLGNFDNVTLFFDEPPPDHVREVLEERLRKINRETSQDLIEVNMLKIYGWKLMLQPNPPLELVWEVKL